MRYDPLRDPITKKEWLEGTKGQTVCLISNYIILGPEGAALQIECCEFTNTLFRADNSVPHEDWPAEVPDPHTLLTNVPPAANCFTVIDLCSAFFSVPLAEESRHLFSFTFQGKQYTCTRMRQKDGDNFTSVIRQHCEQLAELKALTEACILAKTKQPKHSL